MTVHITFASENHNDNNDDGNALVQLKHILYAIIVRCIRDAVNPFMPTVPTFAVRECAVITLVLRTGLNQRRIGNFLLDTDEWKLLP